MKEMIQMGYRVDGADEWACDNGYLDPEDRKEAVKMLYNLIEANTFDHKIITNVELYDVIKVLE